MRCHCDGHRHTIAVTYLGQEMLKGFAVQDKGLYDLSLPAGCGGLQTIFFQLGHSYTTYCLPELR